MKKYKVKLLNGHSAIEDKIIDGYLGNNFDNGKVQLYDRNEAIKKARMFGGKIEEATGLHSVITTMSIMTIPENALLHGVVNRLEGRLAFKDATGMNEEIYHGDVFAEILSEIYEQAGKRFEANLQKIVNQLEELSELVSADYVLITQS